MFDPSAPHIIILLVVVLLLFGSTRLPGAAQALGKSMHIFKRSVKGLRRRRQAARQRTRQPGDLRRRRRRSSCRARRRAWPSRPRSMPSSGSSATCRSSRRAATPSRAVRRGRTAARHPVLLSQGTVMSAHQDSPAMVNGSRRR